MIPASLVAALAAAADIPLATIRKATITAFEVRFDVLSQHDGKPYVRADRSNVQEHYVIHAIDWDTP